MTDSSTNAKANKGSERSWSESHCPSVLERPTSPGSKWRPPPRSFSADEISSVKRSWDVLQAGQNYCSTAVMFHHKEQDAQNFPYSTPHLNVQDETVITALEARLGRGPGTAGSVDSCSNERSITVGSTDDLLKATLSTEARACDYVVFTHPTQAIPPYVLDETEARRKRARTGTGSALSDIPGKQPMAKQGEAIVAGSGGSKACGSGLASPTGAPWTAWDDEGWWAKVLEFDCSSTTSQSRTGTDWALSTSSGQQPVAGRGRAPDISQVGLEGSNACDSTLASPSGLTSNPWEDGPWWEKISGLAGSEGDLMGPFSAIADDDVVIDPNLRDAFGEGKLSKP